MSIEFKNVDYIYAPETPFQTQGLADISFKIKSGSFVAIAGHTGSGKSTLINLIPCFYDATKGEILIDGVNIKNVSQHDLR